MKAVYSVSELARLLDSHITTVYEMIRANQIPGAIRIGTRTKFAKNKIDEWLGISNA